MAPRTITKPEMRTIVLVDAVNFTSELKKHGREAIAPKIKVLQEFAEFFFVFKLRGTLIGKLGDGFLLLCPPTPPETISEALSCQSFIDAYNIGKAEPFTLNVRIAIHYGLISPPERGNYIDTNINLAARLEGATPTNSICISETLHGIVADTLKESRFKELKSTFKGLGENKYYLVGGPSRGQAHTRRESRLSFYLSTLSSLRDVEDWSAVKNTCEQALVDFPGNPEFISQLAYALFILDDVPAAIRHYEDCVERDYDVASSLLFVGRGHLRMGNIERGIEVLEETTQKYPGTFHAYSDIADVYLDQGDLTLAAKWARASLKVNPRFITPMATLLAIHLIQGDDEAGARIIRKVELDRRTLLRKIVLERMDDLGRVGFKTRLNAMFRAAKQKK